MSEQGFLIRNNIFQWVGTGVVAIALGTGVEYFGLPGSHFFGGVIVGIIVALYRLVKKETFPRFVFDASLAVTGVVLGAYFSLDSIKVIATNFIPITIISLGTLAVSLIAGLFLARVTKISRATSLLGMLAGGSAMNIVTGDKIAADVRVVTLMHLLRLLLVLIVTPLLIHFVVSPSTPLSIFHKALPESGGPLLFSLIYTIVLSIIGWWLAVKVPYSGSLILTPLFVAAGAGLMGHGLTPPEGFREVAAMIIGLQVGLRFDREVLETSKKHIPIITLLMVAVIGACGLFAWFLTLYTPFNALTAYLATTPGGRTAVVSLAFTIGADTTAVLAIQTLRLLMMTLIAPFVIQYLVHKKVKLDTNPEIL